jgi:hypothetical protein
MLRAARRRTAARTGEFQQQTRRFTHRALPRHFHPIRLQELHVTRLLTAPRTRPGQVGARRRGPSHVYPTNSGRQRLLVASGCMPYRRVRDAGASLSWGFRWWQVQGSNLGRLSRRFYSPSLLPESLAADQRTRRSRRGSGSPRSAMRPRALDFSGHVATDEGANGHGRDRWERSC